MINIRNLQDCHLLSHEPELFRKVTSYLLYCQYELQEYANEEDLEDFNDFDFMVLSEADLPAADAMLNDLGTPEETASNQMAISSLCTALSMLQKSFSSPPKYLIKFPSKKSAPFFTSVLDQDLTIHLPPHRSMPLLHFSS